MLELGALKSPRSCSKELQRACKQGQAQPPAPFCLHLGQGICLAGLGCHIQVGRDSRGMGCALLLNVLGPNPPLQGAWAAPQLWEAATPFSCVCASTAASRWAPQNHTLQ